MPYGIQAMLKDGSKHMSGVEEAVYKNIEACKQLAEMTATSMGPNGMNKMVINHLEKLFITSDCSTILNQMEVAHPAAKLLCLASAAQEKEIGDGTNLVISLAGTLLGLAYQLIRDGLMPREIADGYNNALEVALKTLDECIIEGSDKLDVRDCDAVCKKIRGSVAAKQINYVDTLCPLIAKACIDVVPTNPNNFNIDNVRICKIIGSSIDNSVVVKGMVVKRPPEGSISCVENAKIAVFAQGVDTSATETKGTVLIHNAEELEAYSKSEENNLEKLIKSISDAGANIILSGATVGDMAMHFIEKYGMLCMKISSKFELRRLCRATGAVSKNKVETPKPEELGYIKKCEMRELGGDIVTVFEQDETAGVVSTIVLRAATVNLMEDVERAIDDGVNSYRALCRDARTVPAGGASEMAIAAALESFGNKQTGLEQYAINKYAEALEVVPRTLAENSGLNGTDTVAAVKNAHAEGKSWAGVDLDGGEPKDLSKENIEDIYSTKWWALKLATEAATTVLKVDTIIMSKQAGGPKKPKSQGHWDDKE